ncbi:hypothetical protein [Aureispira sp. CCB-E]|uniref:hypothetical protein n=1 Tax=Aureispira sp. CCB-E TaxID=3051121 RepID=UPI0028693C73|nr:hypothetical protein [Aureispira sp. CCB-E]WMX15044.1 hypothetical protein QP953_01515 [Aureispira sp. CCB-E]
MLTHRCLLLGLCTFFIIWKAAAQKTPALHEIGLKVNSALDLGFLYKVGKTNSLFRLDLAYLNGRNAIQTTSSQYINMSGAGIGVGWEFRRNIIDNLSFIYGLGAQCSYQTNYHFSNGKATGEEHTISPELYLLLGFSYTLNDQWQFSIENCPYVRYRASISGANQEESQIFYGMNLTNTYLVVAYRFGRRKNKSS